MGKNKTQDSPTQALVKQVFRKNLSEAKAAQKDKNYDIQLAFDMVEPYYSRRQKAVVRMMPEVLGRFKDKYSDEVIQKGFAKISSIPAVSYEDIESHSYILLGATIWILDKLRKHDLLHNAIQILPTTTQSLNMPNMHDSVHSFDLIASMLTVLQERYGKSDHFIVPKTTGRKKDDVFHQILDMIPQEEKDNTVSQFKRAFWDWANLYYEDYNRFTKENEKLDKVFDEYKNQADEIMRKYPQGESKKKSLPFTPLNMSTLSPQNIARLPIQSLEKPKHIDHFARMDALIAKMQDAESAIDSLSERYSDFLFFACRCSMVGRGTLEHAIGKEATDKYYNFPIEDPYAICFALLYLFDLDDDYVWTYGFSTGIVCRAATMLPWGYTEYSNKADELLHDPNTGGYIPAGSLSKSLYNMDYKGNTLFEEDGVPSANLAQIIYEYCGGVLPRNMERYDGLQKELRKKGLKPSQVSTACALMAVLAENSCQSEISFSPNEYSAPGSDLPAVHEEIPHDTDAALLAENERLRKELSNLRESSKREVYAANKEVEELKERLDRANDVIEENSQELADLRGLVFNFQLEANTPEAPVKMTFPQRTTRRIVAFGGHDSWLREIKPKLPDVRFYGENVTSPDIIRKADVVWIQTNCIGHRSYYHIIDLCRKHNRRVRYFGYASTAKCAEQVIEEENNHIV